MARCLREVMPEAASTVAPAGTAALSPLDAMAQRIARNREVMGLHYESDTTAGKRLAELTFELLMRCPTVQAIIAQAKAALPAGARVAA
mgnify:CR=1 FL=1